MSFDEVKIKSNFDFTLFSKESSRKFCLANSLGVVSIKVFVNLRRNYLTVKVGQKAVWKGSIDLNNTNILDFTEPNLDAKEDTFNSVDGIIQHYSQDLTKRLSDLENEENENEEEDDIDMEELEDKLEKFIFQ